MPVRKKKSAEGESVRTTSGGRKVSVVLPPELAARVQRLADTRGETMTKTVVRLVEAGEQAAHEAIRHDAVAGVRAELLAMVGEIGAGVRKEVQGQAHRLSHLLARTALESMAGRVTSGHVLYKLYSDQEKAGELYSGAWKQAVERLKNPTPAVRESLNEIAAGAGSQEPGVLANLAGATRSLQQELGGISTLVEQLQGLQTQQKETQEWARRIADQMRTLSGTVGRVEQAVEAVDAEVKKPRGFFSGRG